MFFTAFRSAFLALSLSVILVVTGCSAAPPETSAAPAPFTPSPTAVTDTEQTTPTAEVLPGATFNVFFPQPEAGLERVYTQEKAGFAEAKLKQDGRDVAKLAIVDTASNPAATSKFAEASDAIAGYPAVFVGKKQTAVLVADRFQVKVISVAADFSADDRREWLQKFDLEGLGRL